MKLTIAIPTYNRNQILIDNLRLLLPQLTAECCVRIFDNCSEIPVAETLRPLLESFPSADCRVIRNPFNIGANANVMHCFEKCETEWIWVIGDDDSVVPEAIATLFRGMKQFPEALFVSYSTAAYPIEATTSWRGLAGFIEGMGSFSNTLFLSTSIYRVNALALGMRIGYQFAYSGAPHLAALLVCLTDESQTCFCADMIVRQNAPEDASERWPLIAHSLAVGTLFDLPLPATVRAALAAKVLATFPAMESILMQLVLLAVKEGDPRNSLAYYDQIQARLYRYDRVPLRRAKRILYRLLLRFPRMGCWFVARAYRATRGRDIDLALLHDRFARM